MLRSAIAVSGVNPETCAVLCKLCEEIREETSAIPLDHARDNIRGLLENIADFCIHDSDDILRFDDYADKILAEFDSIKNKINEG